MIQTIYDKTNGYKTVIGIVIAFIAYGLAGIHILTADQAQQIEALGAAFIAFGLGAKAEKKLGE